MDRGGGQEAVLVRRPHMADETDVATIGIAVDSSPVDASTAALDRWLAKGREVDAMAQRLAASTAQLLSTVFLVSSVETGTVLFPHCWTLCARTSMLIFTSASTQNTALARVLL